MEKLNFPVFEEPLPPPPVFTMNEYARFIQFFVENLLNREAYDKERKEGVVNIPFRLK